MTKDEALRLALEALEYFSDTSPNMAGKAHAEDAITAIKAALEAKDEPVVGTKTWFEDGKVVTQNLYYSDVYTTPPQRTWVGLTADEYAELAEEYGPFPINQIEAKLKEKNT